MNEEGESKGLLHLTPEKPQLLNHFEQTCALEPSEMLCR